MEKRSISRIIDLSMNSWRICAVKCVIFGFIILTAAACHRLCPGAGLVNERIDAIASAIPEPVIPDRMVNLIKFSGHKPDSNGSYDFWPDINRAIDELAAEGGGTLLLPHTAGRSEWIRYRETYRVKGPIQLKSNICLLFEPSVMLYFEFDPRSYLPDGRGVLTRYEGTTLYTFSPLIRAFDAANVVISATGGSGSMPVIDGDGERWQSWMYAGEQRRSSGGREPAYEHLKAINNADVPVRERIYDNPGDDFFRPATIQFFMCRNVLVEGVKITNSPFWCVHPTFSENVIIRNLLFDAQVVNNDGIDPDSSRNVLIENVMFDNHDDNVAVKSGRDREGRDGADITGTELEGMKSRYIRNNRLGGPAENVVIRNCVFKGHYAIAVGSEMSGGVRGVYALNNIAPQQVNMGLFIKSSRKRGGVVDDVYVHNLCLNTVTNDVISVIPNYDDDLQSPYPPRFQNIHISSVSAKNASNGVRIYGWQDAPVENITLCDVRIDNVTGQSIVVSQAKDVILEKVTVNGELLDGHYTNLDSSNKIPHQN